MNATDQKPTDIIIVADEDPEVGGSSPSPRTSPATLIPHFIWRRPGGLPECPYFKLTEIGWLGFAVAIHEWLGDDDRDYLHDHGQWFVTCVLRGGYTDVSYQPGEDQATFEKMRPGYIRFRPAEHRHQVLWVRPGTITLLLKGRRSRRWNFFDQGGRRRVKRDKFFVTVGHHGCRAGERVRLRPDGSRV